MPHSAMTSVIGDEAGQTKGTCRRTRRKAGIRGHIRMQQAGLLVNKSPAGAAREQRGCPQ